NMENFRFGFTASSSRALPQRIPEKEKEDERGNYDPEQLLQCPYDKNHQIRACRLPYHLLKCKKNHPELASKLKACPYNALHLVPKHELTRHTETCESRIPVNPEEAAGENESCPWHVPVSTWVNPNTTEDWEAGMIGSVVVPQFERDLTNRLGRSSRPPNTFPWPDLKL
uniref:Zgc:56699 n=1 Tax=Salarias fasciatus TaxID=181472 RepID=A0A672IRU8_SALFA